MPGSSFPDVEVILHFQMMTENDFALLDMP